LVRHKVSRLDPRILGGSKMKKLKQKELAVRLGISKPYLSMILSGQRKCPPELGEKLSSLGVVNFKSSFSLRGRCPKPLDECAA